MPLFEELSREKAISRMPFQILFPTSMHQSEYRLSNIQYHRPRWAGDRSDLCFSYVSMSGFRSVWVCECHEPDAELDDYDWERLTHEGIAQTEHPYFRLRQGRRPTDHRIRAKWNLRDSVFRS